MKKLIVESGSRKRAVARVTIREGTGIVRVNGVPLDFFEPKLARMKIAEPLMLDDKLASKVDIDIKISGGGFMAQAGAARLGVARALVSFTKSESLKAMFLKYDRHLLVADVRRTEMSKPNDSKPRAKRQKSYR